MKKIAIMLYLLGNINFLMAQINYNMMPLNKAITDATPFNYFNVKSKMNSWLQSNTPNTNSQTEVINQFNNFWSDRINADGNMDIYNARIQTLTINGSWGCSSSGFLPSSWQALGPINYTQCSAGRVRAVWVNPSDIDDILIGTFGGVWQHTKVNNKDNWTCLTDFQIPSCTVLDIAVSPLNRNIIYAYITFHADITNTGGGAIIYSTNKGVTWKIDQQTPAAFLGMHGGDNWEMAFKPNSSLLFVCNKHALYEKNTTSPSSPWFSPPVFDATTVSGTTQYVFHYLKEIDFAPSIGNFAVVSGDFGTPEQIQYTKNGGSVWQPVPFPSFIASLLPSNGSWSLQTSVSVPKNDKMFILFAGATYSYNGTRNALFSYILEFDITNNTPVYVKRWTTNLKDKSEFEDSKLIDFIVFPDDLTQCVVGFNQDVVYKITLPNDNINTLGLFEQASDYYPRENTPSASTTNTHADIRDMKYFYDGTNPGTLFMVNDGGICKSTNKCEYTEATLTHNKSENWTLINGYGLNNTDVWGFDIVQNEQKSFALAAVDGNSWVHKKDINGNYKFGFLDTGDGIDAAISKNKDKVITTENGTGNGKSDYNGYDIRNVNSINLLNQQNVKPKKLSQGAIPDNDDYGRNQFDFEFGTNHFFSATTDIFEEYDEFDLSSTSTQLSYTYKTIINRPTSQNPLITKEPTTCFKWIRNPSSNGITTYYATRQAQNSNDMIKLVKCVYDENAIIPSPKFSYIDITPNNVIGLNGATNALQRSHITEIILDENNPDKIFISFGGVPDLVNVVSVYKTNDGGTNWENISAGLPAIPIHCMVYWQGSDDIIFAGTDAGVYVWNKANNQWECFRTNLPLCAVNELQINYCSNTLMAATNRGIWQTVLPKISSLPINTNNVTEINTNTTWNTDVAIAPKDVLIKSGNTLLIQGTTINGKNSVFSMPTNRRIIVESGASLIIDNATISNVCNNNWEGVEVLTGGDVELINNSELIHFNSLFVRSNAIFNSYPGTRIVVDDYSSVEIEQSGHFLLGSGSFDLASNNSKVSVFGILEIPFNTAFTYTGTGTYDFYDTHQLILGMGSSLNFSGTSAGTGYPMLRLHQFTTLNLGNHAALFANGDIEYEKYSKIVSTQGNVTMRDVYANCFDVSKSYSALEGVDINMLNISNSHFTNFTEAIKLKDFANNCSGPDLLIKASSFDNNITDVEAKNLHYRKLVMNNNTLNGILGSSNTYHGVYIENCAHTAFNNNVINNKFYAGIEALHVPICIIANGQIRNNETGILATESNIFLRNGAKVYENKIGVTVNNDNTNANYPKLTVGDLGCAWIINNEVAGISGNDVELNIDAELLALRRGVAQGSIGNYTPNRFDGNNSIFDICYSFNFYNNVIAATNIIPMKYNYWGGSPLSSYTYHLAVQGTPFCNLGLFSIDDNNSLSSAPTFCNNFSTAPIDFSNVNAPLLGGTVFCWVPTEMQEAFNLNEYEPMDRLSVMANSFFIEDNPIDAFLLLDPIVDVVIMGNNPEAIHEQQDAYGLQQTLMQTAEVQCWGDGSSPARLSAAARKKYKHIAPPPMDSKIGISPNPSNTISNISFSNPTNELFQCQVYNISGVLVQTINNIQANHFEIDVSNYLSGLYYVELKSNTNKYKTKLLVQNN